MYGVCVGGGYLGIDFLCVMSTSLFSSMKYCTDCGLSTQRGSMRGVRLMEECALEFYQRLGSWGGGGQFPSMLT